MNVSIIELIQKMNCSYYISNKIMKDADCSCPFSCKDTFYKYSLRQSPWPHLSYHLALYKDVIRNMSFADRFSDYYEPLLEMWNAGNISFIYPALKETDLISRNFIQVHVKMDSDLLVKYVEKEALSWESFVGSLGGLLNLWTGVSFFAFVEVVELVYRLVWPSGKVGENKGGKNSNI